MAYDLPSPAPSILTNLAEVVHVAYNDDPSWLVAVQFRFDEGYLHVEVDPDDDTVEVSFDPRQRPQLRHWMSDSVPIQMNQYYAGLLSMTSVWRWVLRNQQGYEDAFQIELSTSSSTTTLQYLAVASRLHLRHVNDASIP
ncbi:DUF6334 family protein [Plantactinospora solaniradicis]|uniref:DUF6334 family protein n=1 Tax=Plantactinospora solaniradicis TaxID=1723736 RepID=A0ABW1KR39_9ACTN